MLALRMVMAQGLGDRFRQGRFAQHHHPMLGFLLDRAPKPFAMGVEMWTPRGQDDGFHITRLQESVAGLRARRVSVVDEGALAQEASLQGIGQLAGALLHEGGGGLWCQSCHLSTPWRQLHHHHHENIIGDEVVPRRDLNGEKVRGYEPFPEQPQTLPPLILAYRCCGAGFLWGRRRIVRMVILSI
jgi:hypothetical protein